MARLGRQVTGVPAEGKMSLGGQGRRSKLLKAHARGAGNEHVAELAGHGVVQPGADTDPCVFVRVRNHNGSRA